MSDKRDAEILREAAKIWSAYRSKANTQFLDDIHKLADQIDPPAPPLPTKLGWHPNVRLKDSGTYLTGAVLTNHYKRPWVIISEIGLAVNFPSSEVEVVPETPKKVNLGDPCPPVGTRWKAGQKGYKDVYITAEGKRVYMYSDHTYANPAPISSPEPWETLPDHMFPLTLIKE